MSRKPNSWCALAAALIGVAGLRAQEPPPNPRPVDQEELPAPSKLETVSAPETLPRPGLSNWITYSHGDCCGPVGGDGPIVMELYIRTGVALEVGGSTLSSALDEGFVIDGGGRSLFFNTQLDRAWTVDLGIGDIHNYASGFTPNIPMTLNTTPAGSVTQSFTNVLVNVRELNRTYVHTSTGFEYYLVGSAECCDRPRWRLGFDGGGRLGSSKVDFRSFVLNRATMTPNTTVTIPHSTDVMGAVTASLHSDYERPLKGCCSLFVGFRLEWAYNWMDVLGPGNGSDVQDLSLLLNAGIKF
jgi:hypothetical protein